MVVACHSSIFITYIICAGLFSIIAAYFFKQKVICVNISDDNESATAQKCSECPEIEGTMERYKMCNDRLIFSLFYIRNAKDYFSSLQTCITKYGGNFDAVQTVQSQSGDVANVKTWLPVKLQPGHMGRAHFPLENSQGETTNQTITMTDDYWSIEDLYQHEKCEIPRPDEETIRHFNRLVIGPTDRDIAIGLSMKMQNSTVICIREEKRMGERWALYEDIVIEGKKMIIYGYAETYEFCNRGVFARLLYVPHKASGISKYVRVEQCREPLKFSVRDPTGIMGLRTRFNTMLRGAITVYPISPNGRSLLPGGKMSYIEKDGFQEDYLYNYSVSKNFCK